jgi:hypothetical protein
MRFLLVLLAVLSGLVLPEMAGATRVQVAGMRASLREEPVAAPQPEACLAPGELAPRSDPVPDDVIAALPVSAGVQACSIALTDRPLE